MKRFKVLTREVSHRMYVVEAEDKDDINIEGLDSDEYYYEYETIEIEEIKEGRA